MALDAGGRFACFFFRSRACRILPSLMRCGRRLERGVTLCLLLRHREPVTVLRFRRLVARRKQFLSSPIDLRRHRILATLPPRQRGAAAADMWSLKIVWVRMKAQWMQRSRLGSVATSVTLIPSLEPVHPFHRVQNPACSPYPSRSPWPSS